MPVHQFILALQGRMKIALVRMNLRISWKIFLHRKWDLNRLVSKVWYGKRTQLGFGGLNVSPWVNYKMHWNTYDETNVPIRTVLLPNALSMGTLSCMNIYFVHLIRCSWMVTLRKDGSKQLFQWYQTRVILLILGTGDHFVSFRSLASVTRGHGTQALYWRCAKQKDCAKIFHCFKSENKASSSSAPPTTAVASLYTFDPQEFLGRPRRCGCSAIRGRRVWPRKHALPPHISGRQSCNLSKKH